MPDEQAFQFSPPTAVAALDQCLTRDWGATYPSLSLDVSGEGRDTDEAGSGVVARTPDCNRATA